MNAKMTEEGLCEIIAWFLDGPRTFADWSQDYQNEIRETAQAVLKAYEEYAGAPLPLRDIMVVVAEALDYTMTDPDDWNADHYREIESISRGIANYAVILQESGGEDDTELSGIIQLGLWRNAR